MQTAPHSPTRQSAAQPDAAPVQAIAAPQVNQTVATVQAAPLPAQRVERPSTSGTAASALVALVLVIGLILLLAKLARRIPGFSPGSSSGSGGMRLVSSLTVGARDKLLVVETGQQQWLVGIGEGGPRLLSELAQPLPESAAAVATSSPLPGFAGNFAQVLAQHFKRA